MSEQWCGCDGAGMAHQPGATTFNCESAESLRARLAKAIEEVARLNQSLFQSRKELSDMATEQSNRAEKAQAGEASARGELSGARVKLEEARNNFMAIRTASLTLPGPICGDASEAANALSDINIDNALLFARVTRQKLEQAEADKKYLREIADNMTEAWRQAMVRISDERNRGEALQKELLESNHHAAKVFDLFRNEGRWRRDAEAQLSQMREALAEVTPRYEAFMMQVPTNGDIQVLQKCVGALSPAPKYVIPANERWLYENKDALNSVRQGLKEAAEGKVVEGPNYPPLQNDQSES